MNEVVRVQILHINIVAGNYKMVYDKIINNVDEYMSEMPLRNAEKEVCGTIYEMEQEYISEDASVGVYHLPNNHGYLIQIFSAPAK